MKILIKNARQGNPYFNPSTANNGGGYDQPMTVSEWDNGWKVTVEDTSCGDFGPRWSIAVTDADGADVGTVRFNGMDGDSVPSVRFASPVTAGWDDARENWVEYTSLPVAHTFRLLVVWGLGWLGSRFRAELHRSGETYTVRCV